MFSEVVDKLFHSWFMATDGEVEVVDIMQKLHPSLQFGRFLDVDNAEILNHRRHCPDRIA